VPSSNQSDQSLYINIKKDYKVKVLYNRERIDMGISKSGCSQNSFIRFGAQSVARHINADKKKNAILCNIYQTFIFRPTST
jgi:hypothetical protein